MFNSLLEKINALNYIDNNIGLYIFLGILWLIVMTIIIIFLKNVKTLQDASHSLIISTISLFCGFFITAMHVEHNLREKIDEKIDETCYIPIEGIKSNLTKNEIKNMTYDELWKKSLNYYKSNYRLLSNYIFNNLKNRTEVKPTKEMNIAYTQAIEDLKLIKNELDYRRKQCLIKMCNNEYYPKDLYQSKEKHVYIFHDLQKYNCNNKGVNNGNN